MQTLEHFIGGKSVAGSSGRLGPIFDPAWTVSEVGLEDLMLAYMKQPSSRDDRSRHLEVQK